MAGLASLKTTSCGIRMGASCFPTPHHQYHHQPLITAEKVEDGKGTGLAQGHTLQVWEPQEK